MEVNASTLIGLQKTFRALYRESFDSATPMWPMFAMEAPSENAQENYQWLGALPALREWIDTKIIDELRGYDYTIKNKSWEATIGVDRDHIEDDQLGLYRPRIAELALRAAQHPDKLLAEVRVAGASQLGYDGQFFYDTDHVSGSSGTLSNKLTGTGVSVAQLTADFRAARAAMLKYKDDRGEPFINAALLVDRANPPFVVTAPPDLHGAFEELLTAQQIGNTTNVLFGAAKLVVDPRLADSNDWYLDYTGGMVKAFVLQMRKRPMPVAQEDPNSSETVFMRKKFMYGIEGRWNVGYGLWQFSVLTTNT